MANLDDVSDGIENPEAEQHADQVANRALTLVKNTRGAFPFANPDRSCIVVLAETRFSQEGRRLIDEARRRSAKTAVRWLDPSADAEVIDDVAQKAAGCEAIAVAAFVSASAYRGNVALPGGFSDLVTRLIAAKAPVILVAFGNPYLLRSFPDAAAYMAAFSTTTTSEAAVVRALFGEIPISGRMPVSIPGFAKIGDGIQTGAVHPVSSN
jgi:beta-N-acetylhexosaminidase